MQSWQAETATGSAKLTCGTVRPDFGGVQAHYAIGSSMSPELSTNEGGGPE